MLPLHSGSQEYRTSTVRSCREKVMGWMRLVLSDKQSRNLFFFLLLNLSMAFVELSYGMWTNSLGLISDSFHMFFDCTALLAGLVASVVAKWRANPAFSYGYVRVEILAGFVNGLFLLFIAFFILSEAVERAFEPPQVKHDRLFLISVLGFLINLIGIFVFQHGGDGHGHSHGGHGHSHGGHGHSHGGHGSEGKDSGEGGEDFVSGGTRNKQILEGVFLHVLADTLGSVGVIISSLLIYYFDLMIADPICSIFIAVLVGISVIPLLRNSIGILLQRTPVEIENQLPGCYQRVSQLEGVYSVHEPHFWTLCSDVYVGALKVEVSPTADSKFIVSQTHNLFTQIGVRQLYVQIDVAAT